MAGRESKKKKRKRVGKLPEARPGIASHPVILAAFGLSGLAGLMHQVVWAKLLRDLIG